MEKKTNTEIVISDVVKLFKGKKRIIILTLAICVALGIGYTFVNTHIYGNFGNTVSFRLTSPECADRLLPILESTSFAEKLLLNENGLPDKELCNPEDYKAALEAIEAYRQGVESAKQAKQEAESFYYSITFDDGTLTTWDAVSQNYEKLQQKCSDILVLLDIYKSANAEAVVQDPNHIQKTAEYEAQLADALLEKDTFEKEVYQKALEKKNLLDRREIQELSRLSQLRKTADQCIEKVLSEWRVIPEVKSEVTQLAGALTFEINEIKGTDTATAFINISVSVPRDKEFADYIIRRVSSYLPERVCETVEALTNSIETECILLSSVSNTKNLDASNFYNNLRKNTIICTIAGIAILFVAIVGKEYISRAMMEDDK